MILTVATLTWLTAAQAVDTRPDRHDARAPADSIRSVVIVPTATFGHFAGTEISDSIVTQRRRAVQHSDWYYRRLAIHKAASFATVPLFVTEYILGDKLYDGNASGSVKSAHSAVATGIGVLFGVNTVTGVWNLWDSRHEADGRARRTTHAILMLASDAGFVATAALAPDDDREFGDGNFDSDRKTHRAVAISSMGVSLASYLMMYLWK
jgi:hypothetical protein